PDATPRYVHAVEQLVIDVLGDLGLQGAGRAEGYPGVWVVGEAGPPRKICAIGVRLTRGRSMHGFALNVDPDLSMFGHIVPCGIRDRGVTSIARLLGRPVEMRTVVDAVVARFAEEFAPAGAADVDRQDVVWREHPSDLSAFTLQATSNRRSSERQDSPEERQNGGPSNRRSSERQDNPQERQN